MGKEMTKPYEESQISENEFIRIFSPDTPEEELIWHRDREDRVVTPLNSNDWQLQIDDQLPIYLKQLEKYSIPKGVFHRVIKGKTPLTIKLIKKEAKK